jgi:aryl-alcohol dehydrogenase-like predicted oxidoreductase
MWPGGSGENHQAGRQVEEIVPSGMALPEMALRFILSHPAVSTTIADAEARARAAEHCGE